MYELELMATDNCSENRLIKICEVRSWLRTFVAPGFTGQYLPCLQILTDFNEDKN